MPVIYNLKKTKQISKINVSLLIVLLALAVSVLAGCGENGTGNGSKRDDTQIQTYTVSFITNGGSPAVPSMRVEYGDTVTAPNTTLSREGYDFQGWYSDSGLTTPVVFPYPVMQNTALYAKWAPKIYTVTFVTNGGSSVQPIQVQHGAGMSSASVESTLEGHDLEGWYSDSGLAYRYDFSSLLTQSITLYAKWTPKTYTVTFVANGGSSVTARSVIYGDAIDASPATAREGYDFDGWYANSNFSGGPATFPYVVSGNTTLYARWEAIPSETENYSVKFNVDGAIIDTVYVVYGTSIGTSKMPLNPEKPGYDFVGWNTNPYASDANFYASTPATSDTVYAIWTPKTYTVTFVTNGGSTVTARSVIYGEAINTSPATAREGYDFDGWYVNSNFSGGPATFPYVVSENTTFYARWEAIPSETENYSVKFNVDGAIIDTVYVVYGTGIGTSKMPLKPEKLGYDFVGWNTNPYASDANFYASTPATSDTVYAIWTIRTYSVTFDSDGVAFVPTQQVTHGNTVSAPADEPTRTNYIFDGWYSDSDLTVPAQFPASVTYNITFYAKWTPFSPVVSIILNLPTLTIEAGTTQTLNATVLPAAATNKTVIWESDNEKVAEVDDSGVVTANIVGTAVIYVTAEDNSGIQASCAVTVTPNTSGTSPYAMGKYSIESCPNNDLSCPSNDLTDRIKYSFKHDEYDFYYIYLGEMLNIPVYSENALYHPGGGDDDPPYIFTRTRTEQETIRQVVEDNVGSARKTIEENSFSLGGNVGLSIKQGIEASFDMLKVNTELMMSAEEKWDEYRKNSREFTETKSLTNTIEWTTSTTISSTHTYPKNFTSSDKIGWYKWTLFMPSDVYLYIIRNSVTNEIYYEFREYVIPVTPGWALDFSENLSFRKSDLTHFEFDVSMLDGLKSLPRPELGPGIVIFDLNGATGTTPAQQQSPATLPGLPSAMKPGHNFKGWNTRADGAGTLYYAGDIYNSPIFGGDGVILYADWYEIGPGSVVFNINGGSGTAPASISPSVAGGTIVLPGNPYEGFKRSYNIFVGWCLTSACTGQIPYKPGDSFPVPAGTTTLYAKWTANPTDFKLIRSTDVRINDGPGGSTGNKNDLFNQYYDTVNFSTSFDGIDLAVMREQGYEKISFSIELLVSEINEGIQWIFLYKSTDKQTTELLAEKQLDAKSGIQKNVTHSLAFNDISIDKFKTNDFVIRYAASGNGDDDWENRNLKIKLYFTK